MAATFETRTTIARPPAEVFAVAIDVTRAHEWMPAIVKLEPVDEGPVRVGWRFKETRRMKGREMTAVIEVTEHRGPEDGAPPYVHAARSAAMGVEGVYRFTFSEPSPGSTEVHLRADVRATNFLAKPLVGMAAKAMKEQDGDLLERLKQRCEAGGAEGAES